MTHQLTRILAPTVVVRRRLLAFAAVVLTALAVALAGLVLTTVDGLAPAAGTDRLALAGGSLTAGPVVPEVMAHNPGMPATMMPDPVPDGFQRFSVEVTLHADSAVTYAADRFRVTAPGMRAAAPLRDTLGEGTASAGSQVNGTMVFQIPEDVRSVSLVEVGGDDALRLVVPVGTAHHADEDGTAVADAEPLGGVVAPGDGHRKHGH
jgi:hypothetical protein